MPFIVIIIGAIMVVAAFNETHGDLGNALKADIPGYFKWAMAIAAILGLGFIPGMKIPSRWLIALVALVVVLKNWQAMINGFKNFATQDPTTGGGNPDPTTAYVTSAGQSGTPTAAQIAGTSAVTGIPASPATAAAQLSANPFNPGAYIGTFAGMTGFGGF